MRKIFSYAIAGLAAVSFSQLALAQTGEQGQNSTQYGSGASGDKDNYKRRGKGQAKGWDRGKGHGRNDKRHAGRHSDDRAVSQNSTTAGGSTSGKKY